MYLDLPRIIRKPKGITTNISFLKVFLKSSSHLHLLFDNIFQHRFYFTVDQSFNHILRRKSVNIPRYISQNPCGYFLNHKCEITIKDRFGKHRDTAPSFVIGSVLQCRYNARQTPSICLYS